MKVFLMQYGCTYIIQIDDMAKSHFLPCFLRELARLTVGDISKALGEVKPTKSGILRPRRMDAIL